jgi:hypothetical protein
MKFDSQLTPIVAHAARRILAISPTVAGLGSAPRESIEKIHLTSESSLYWVNYGQAGVYLRVRFDRVSAL